MHKRERHLLINTRFPVIKMKPIQIRIQHNIILHMDLMDKVHKIVNHYLLRNQNITNKLS